MTQQNEDLLCQRDAAVAEADAAQSRVSVVAEQLRHCRDEAERQQAALTAELGLSNRRVAELQSELAILKRSAADAKQQLKASAGDWESLQADNEVPLRACRDGGRALSCAWRA